MSRGTIAILGGSGFLGSHLIGPLQRAGWQVRVLDVVRPRDGEQGGAVFRHTDVRDAAAVAAGIAGAQVVVHAAFASPHAPRPRIHEVNVGGAAITRDAAVRVGVRHLIAISSTIVEQPLRGRLLPARAAVRGWEEYRSSRVRAEELIRGADLPTAIVRPKTFIGPGRVGGFALVFAAIASGGVVPLLGDGSNAYQLVDVRDLAAGLVQLAGTGGVGTFGFGASSFGSIGDDLAGLADHAATGARLVRVPAPLARAGIAAMDLLGMAPLAEWHRCGARGRDSVIDVSRARDELGWRPRRSNLDALIDAYDWYAARVGAGRDAPSTHPIPRAHRALGQVLRVGH